MEDLINDNGKIKVYTGDKNQNFKDEFCRDCEDYKKCQEPCWINPKKQQKGE